MKTRLLFFVASAAALLATGCGKGDDLVSTSEGSAPDEPTRKVAPELVIADSDYRIGTAQKEMKVAFDVNVVWSVAIEYEGEETAWLAITPEKGDAGPAEVALRVTENAARASREAAVCIVYGGRTHRVHIMQEGAADKPQEAAGPELKMYDTPAANYDCDDGSWSYFFKASEPEEATACFTVNRDWTVAIDYANGVADWLTVAPGSGAAGEKIVLTMAAAHNPTGAGREARVVISYANKTQPLIVRQEGLNLAKKFDPLFAQELEKRGYIADDRYITPEEVKRITVLQMHGPWNAAQQKYLGKLISLRGIEYFESLTDLTCWGNQLTELDMSHNPALRELQCYNNALTKIDVSRNPQLLRLSCHSNRLESIDVSRNPKLVRLSCGSNLLTDLDVTNNPALLSLLCERNRFTTLYLGDNPALETLWCEFNLLPSLDMSRNRSVSHLRCFQNPGDGTTFPIFCWFDNETIPQKEDRGDERTPMMWFTTDSWICEGHEIRPDYRKAD